MGILKLKNGYELECLAVLKGQRYPFIYIYMNVINMAEACEIFDGHPEDLETITFTRMLRDEEGKPIADIKTYEGYTWFVAVRKDTYENYENVIRIHLEKPGMEF